MLVAIHQPEYFPWLGYFEKMLRADVFVLLDAVQFSKGDYQNRNRIKGPGGAQWLTIPVVQNLPQKISEVRVADNRWQERHWNSLVTCYSKAKYFTEYAAPLKDFYRQSGERLIDYTVGALELIAGALDIEKNWVLSSKLGAGGRRSELVLNICRELGASAYYSGRAGGAYLNREEFRRAGIEIRVQNFVHPEYEQLFTKESGFISHLSTLDLLLNCGPRGRDVICSEPTRDSGLMTNSPAR